MFKFLYKIINHLILFLLLFLISFTLLEDDEKWKKEFWFYHSDSFQTKKKYFEKMINKSKNVNLLLGSSHMHRGVIPDSIGTNWFSFSNGAQTIYDSHKFLKYYIDSTQIDTIVISVAPFDFAKTYLVSNFNFIPNGDFITFGNDTISEFAHNLNKKAHLHKLKTRFFPNIFKLITIIGKRITYMKNQNNTSKNSKNNLKDDPYITSQGYLYNPDKTYKIENVDVLISNDNNFRRTTIESLESYFSSVSNEPNMKNFDLFNSFCLENNIDVIYMYPPTINYFRQQIKEKYGSKWELIKQRIDERNVTVWDYENYNDLMKYAGFFYDATHLSYDGAEKFSNEIKKKLINERSGY